MPTTFYQSKKIGSNDMLEQNKKVNWTIFSWAIGIIFALFVWVFGGMAAINGRINQANGDVSKMEKEILEQLTK
ncbi:MAG: hypothetical protein ACKKMR_02275 [Candidatus Nealsonbacteria bacterium]